MRQFSLEYIFYISASILYFLDRQRVFAANDTAVNGTCSNHCSQQDKTDECWKKTEQYYDSNLANALNDWIAVETNVDQWNKRQTPEIPRPSDAEVIDRVTKSLPSGAVLDADHLQQIIPILLNLTYSKSESIIRIGMPEFTCPIPCDYDSRLWEYLFIASILVNIAMLLVVIPFIIKSERRDKKLYAKQVSMMQMLKPTSKSRNPSAS